MIQLKNVSFNYGKKVIIKEADVNIKKNKITIVVGPNGCGKTTLLKIISGLLPKKTGDIFIDGKDINDYKRNEIAKKISFMPQMRHTPDMTVNDFLMCARYPYMGINKSPSEADITAVNNAITSTNLSTYAHKNLKKLSGGERQKVYFAMTLAQNTDIILMDEPTTYLDMDKQYEILDLIKRMKNKTIVMVMHDLTYALKYADYIVVMDNGQIIYSGSVEEVLNSDILSKVYNVKVKEIFVDGHKEYIVVK